MKKIISAVSAVALFGCSALASIAPASAADNHFQRQDESIGGFCNKNPKDGQCSDWQTNHSRWDNDRYQGFYRDHKSDGDFGNPATAALFGFAIGAAVGSTVK